MKRVSALLLAVCVLLAGCQATPETPVVVQKDLEQMIGKATATDSAEAMPNASLRERLGVPDTLTAELVSAKGKLKIHVDANTVVPDVQGVSTTRVGMGVFTDDDVMRLNDTLFGGAMPIDPVNTQITQAVKMRTIQGLLEQKETGKLDKYESMEELDAAIEDVMREAAGLPGHFERVEPDFSFKPLGDGGSEVFLRAAPDDATISELSILNAAEGIGYSRVEYYRDLSEYATLSYVGEYSFNEMESPYFKPPSMGEDGARKIAEETVAALELKDFVLSGYRMNALYNPGVDAEDAPRRGVYEYMFTRQIGGVPVTYTNDDGTSFDGDKEKIQAGYYIFPWMYEKVRIIIDDGGILCFLWHSPYVVTETVTDSSAILPFADIQNTFEKMIPIVDNHYDTSEQDVTCDMYVTEVRLGLARVTEKDIGTSALLIPVWDFMGYTEDSAGQTSGKGGYNAVMTINAIDGSIIDRRLGY